MKFFIDTADLDEIGEALSWGCLAGVTTNPSLYAKTGGSLSGFEEHMTNIKLPVCAEALAATRTLASEGVRVNMTLVFSAPQALLAANAGARYISPFIGRFDDISEDGLDQLGTVIACVHNYDWAGRNPDDTVEIIAASVRTPHHVTQAALLGADIATVPLAALRKCLRHPLTDQGLTGFDAAWEKVRAQG